MCGLTEAQAADGLSWLQWTPGTAGAAAALNRFLANSLPGFSHNRSKTDCESTSRLSPHIHLGELSVRQIYFAVRVVFMCLGS